MKKKSLFAGTMAAVMVIGMMTGCGDSSVKENAEDTAAETTEEATAEVEKETEGSASDGASEQIKIGFSIQDISNPSWSEMYNHMEAKAEELGAQITLSDCKADPAKQIDSLENFVNGGYDVIIVHCFDAESATSTLEKAKEKGIKIVAYDTYLEQADCYYGLDNYEVGKQIAKNASEFIEEKFEDGECQIGICNYPLNQVCIDRAAGISDGLAEYAPNAEVVAEAQAGYTDEGIEVGENFMQAYPDMKVIVGIDDAGLLGVYEAIKGFGKQNDEDMGLFGIDALDEALKLISEDTVFRSTIYLDLNTVGEQMVQTAYDLCEGKEVEETVYFPMETIKIDNVGEYLTE